MGLYKDKYRIDSTRLKDWDYSSDGHYFITICTRDKKCFFGDVEDGKVRLTSIGKVADGYWQEIPMHFPSVKLDEYVVMPNHVHGIIIITNDNVETQHFASLQSKPNKFGSQSNNLASIIRGYKIGVKKWSTINGIYFAWQPRFYEHIIRNEESLEKIRKYILNNPIKWELDEYHPENLIVEIKSEK
jgi:REP element-mobilizing transposase RayT